MLGHQLFTPLGRLLATGWALISDLNELMKVLLSPLSLETFLDLLLEVGAGWRLNSRGTGGVRVNTGQLWTTHALGKALRQLM